MADDETLKAHTPSILDVVLSQPAIVYAEQQSFEQTSGTLPLAGYHGDIGGQRHWFGQANGCTVQRVMLAPDLGGPAEVFVRGVLTEQVTGVELVDADGVQLAFSATYQGLTLAAVAEAASLVAWLRQQITEDLLARRSVCRSGLPAPPRFPRGVAAMIEWNMTWAATVHVDGPPPYVFVQWKGTDVCLDFTCQCGYEGHFDGDFAYGLRCGSCGVEWQMPSTFGMVGRDPDTVQDTDLPHRDRATTDAGYPLVLDEPMTEYALGMAGGDMTVRSPRPDHLERRYPVAKWIRNEQQNGGKIYRRRIVVIEDRAEVTEP